MNKVKVDSPCYFPSFHAKSVEGRLNLTIYIKFCVTNWDIYNKAIYRSYFIIFCNFVAYYILFIDCIGGTVTTLFPLVLIKHFDSATSAAH